MAGENQELLRLEFAFRAAIKAEDKKAIATFGEAIRNLKAAEASPPNTGQGSFLDPLAEGATFGLRDEIKGVGGLFAKMFADVTGQGLGKSEITGDEYGYGDVYSDTRDSAREDLASFTERNPKTSLALELGGSLATGGLTGAKALGGKAFQQLSNAKQLAKVAKVAGAEGAVYGYGKGEGADDSIQGAITEGAKAALLGPAMHQGMKAAAPLFREVKNKANKIVEAFTPTTTLDDLTAHSKSLYKQLDSANVVIKQEPFDKMANELLHEIQSVGISGSSRKTMTAGMNELAKVKSPSFTDLQKIKKLFTTAKLGPDMGLRQASNTAIKRIDEFMSKLTPDEILHGDIKGVGSILSEAKDTWHRQAQATTLTNLQTRARRSEAALAGQSDIAMRSKLRQIMDSERKSLGFDEEVLTSMDEIIQGSTRKNAQRRLAEMAPGARTARGEVPTLTAAAFGAMKTGKAELMLIAAALPSVVGGAFRHMANESTEKEIKVLMNSIVNRNQIKLEKVIDTLVNRQSSKIGMSAAALSNSIINNLDAEPGFYEPDEEYTSLGDMVSP